MLNSLYKVLTLIQQQLKTTAPDSLSKSEIADIKNFLAEDFESCITLCLENIKNDKSNTLEEAQSLATTITGKEKGNLYWEVKKLFYLKFLNITLKNVPEPFILPNPQMATSVAPWPKRMFVSLDIEEGNTRPIKKISTEEVSATAQKAPTKPGSTHLPNHFDSPPTITARLDIPSPATTSPLLRAKFLAACQRTSKNRFSRGTTTLCFSLRFACELKVYGALF